MLDRLFLRTSKLHRLHKGSPLCLNGICYDIREFTPKHRTKYQKRKKKSGNRKVRHMYTFLLKKHVYRMPDRQQNFYNELFTFL